MLRDVSFAITRANWTNVLQCFMILIIHNLNCVTLVHIYLALLLTSHINTPNIYFANMYSFNPEKLHKCNVVASSCICCTT